MKGTGAEFFPTLKTELKELPFVAENLGVITPEVEGLRKEFGFPEGASFNVRSGIIPRARVFGSLDEGCYSTFYGTLPCFMLAEQGGLTP